LHKNKNPDEIPCHRVVNSKGELAKNYRFGGREGQKKRLTAEGVKQIINYKIKK
jgi:methylated-DNA-protein-cysteine methyltransferase related protein